MEGKFSPLPVPAYEAVQACSLKIEYPVFWIRYLTFSERGKRRWRMREDHL